MLGHPAEHGVDKPGISSGTAVSLRQADREVDSSMIGHFEPENLCSTEQEDRFGPRRIGGKSLFKVAANQMTQCTEAAQNSCREPPRQGAVPLGKGRQSRMCVLARELLIQGNSPPQNAVEDIGSNSSSSEAGNFRLGGRARTRHTRIVVAKLCPRRELPPKMSENAQLFVEGSYLPSAMARSLRLPSSEACAALPAASM